MKGKSLFKISKLLPLIPVIDSDGLLRSNFRLKYAEFMSFDLHPIILPRHLWIVKFVHEKNDHSSTNHTLTDLSTQCWVIHAREVIRK